MPYFYQSKLSFLEFHIITFVGIFSIQNSERLFNLMKSQEAVIHLNSLLITRATNYADLALIAAIIHSLTNKIGLLMILGPFIMVWDDK